ncbi:MAG: type III pantothenate kinase [Oscillospiraceae bacterium]|nr:type III pantothenate kinase [Oscillospiraceae bacterium]
MILAIDVGNTNIVLGCIDEGEIVSVVRIHTDTRETEAEYTIKLKEIIYAYGMALKAIDGVILSSVVPPVTESIRRAVRQLTGFECMVVGPGIKTGMNIRIDDPGTVAGDLIVGGVAAMQFYGTPAIVLDLGTATTATVIDENGCFRGGAIMPGVKLSYGALAAGTSLLPEISITPPKKCIATNTVDCMRAGAVFGTAAMIDGLIDRMEAELGTPCKLVATGGLASSIVSCCRHEIVCDDDLLLKGMWYLYEKNK